MRYLFIFLFIHFSGIILCVAQTIEGYLPTSPLVFNASDISIDNISQSIRSIQPDIENDSVIAMKKHIEQNNNQINDILKKIESEKQKNSLQMQAIYSLKDLQALKEQIKNLKLSKDKSQQALEDNLANTSHKGLFVVVIKSVGKYPDKNILIKKAEDALSLLAIEKLNGMHIRRLTKVSSFTEISDIIEAFVGGEIKNNNTPYLGKIYPKDETFLYFNEITVSPLKGMSKVADTTQAYNSPDCHVISVGDSASLRQQLLALGIPERDIVDLMMSNLALKLQNIQTENVQSDTLQRSILRDGNAEIVKLNMQILQHEKDIRQRTAELRAIVERINPAMYNAQDPEKSAEQAIAYYRSEIQKLDARWKDVREYELYFNRTEAHITIEGDPIDAIARKAMELYEQFKSSNITKIKKFSENTIVEDGSKVTVKTAREIELTRAIEKIWLYPVPGDDDYILTLVAKFKIVDAAPTENTSQELSADVEIHTLPLRETTFSVSGTGEAIRVPYRVTGVFNSNNFFEAYISDFKGGWARERPIGAIRGTSSGEIAAVIPADLLEGEGYRIRVKASSPEVTGADNGQNLTIKALSVKITKISANHVYITSKDGGVLQIAYTVSGAYQAGNIFMAYLSDAAGKWLNEVPIGTASSTAGGTISAKIPANTPAGMGYRVRIKATKPAISSRDNGADIQVSVTQMTVLDYSPTVLELKPNEAHEITVQISAKGEYLDDNEFQVFLSDEKGLFSPTQAPIGVKPQGAGRFSITALVPADAVPGANYVLKVCATKPFVEYIGTQRIALLSYLKPEIVGVLTPASPIIKENPIPIQFYLTGTYRSESPISVKLQYTKDMNPDHVDTFTPMDVEGKRRYQHELMKINYHFPENLPRGKYELWIVSDEHEIMSEKVLITVK